MGRPKGSINKLNGSRIQDILDLEGVDLIKEMIAIARRGDDEMQFRIWKELLPYIYAKRREEDANGKAADIVAVPMTTDEAKDYIKAARGDR